MVKCHNLLFLFLVVVKVEEKLHFKFIIDAKFNI